MSALERVLAAKPWRRGTSEHTIEHSTSSIISRASSREQLVDLFSKDVWRYASSQLTRKEDAEDVVMEVFAVACSEFRRVASADNQRLWLLTVAKRKVADTLRRRYRRAEEPLGDLTDATSHSLTEEQVATRQALYRLAENEREALVLKYVSGLSTREVATVLRKTDAATNSLLQRAREAMRRELEDTGMSMTGDLK